MPFDPYEIKIIPGQAKVREEQLIDMSEHVEVLSSVEEIDDFVVCYTSFESLMVTPDKLVWLDNSESTVYFCAKETIYSDQGFIKIIKIPEGFVVDLSEYIGEVLDDDKKRVYFEVEHLVNKDELEDFVPVLALLEDEDDVKRFKELLWQNYKIVYPDAMFEYIGFIEQTED
jgi:hypothetical protein